MQHLPEILKILEGALQRDVPKVQRYADLLAAKLEQEGDGPSAAYLRKTLKDIKPRALRPAESAAKVPLDTDSRVSLAETTYPSLDDVQIVLDQQVDKLLAGFVKGYQRADDLMSAGLTGPGHVLLYGPPGCGKTHAAKFLAASLRLPLVTARLDGLVSSFLGSTAKNIRFLFDFVDKTPCVLLLDEFDALAKMRDDPHELGELKRVVNSLLQNIDFLPTGTVVIAATNHEHLLDPAVWRRFELHVLIGMPDNESRRRLFELYGMKNTISDRDIPVLAALTEGFSGADIRSVCEMMAREMILEDLKQFDLARVVDPILLHRSRGVDGNRQAWPDKLEDRIASLRKMSKTVFTYDVISRVLGVSKGKISNVLSHMTQS